MHESRITLTFMTEEELAASPPTVEDTDVVKHYFDVDTATRYGLPAAIVYQYFRWLCQRVPSGTISRTITDICEQYAYMGRKEVRLAMATILKHRLIRRLKENRHQYELDKEPRGYADDSLHMFEVQCAIEHGIIAAVIYSNMHSLITTNWVRKAEELAEGLKRENYYTGNVAVMTSALQASVARANCRLSLDQWVEIHPFVSRRSVYRQFEVLMEANKLQKVIKSDRVPVWTLPSKTLKKFGDYVLRTITLENASVKKTTPMPKGPSQCQKDQKSDVNDCAATVSATVNKIYSNTITKTNDGIGNSTSSLADAREEAGRRPSRCTREARGTNSAKSSAPDLEEAKKEEVAAPAPAIKRVDSICLEPVEETVGEDTRIDTSIADAREAAKLKARMERRKKARKAMAPEAAKLAATIEKRKMTRKAIGLLQKLRILNKKTYPEMKKKVMLDSFGHPIIRKYQKQYTPDDYEFLEALEGMPESERAGYLEKGLALLKARAST